MVDIFENQIQHCFCYISAKNVNISLLLPKLDGKIKQWLSQALKSGWAQRVWETWGPEAEPRWGMEAKPSEARYIQTICSC